MNFKELRTNSRKDMSGLPNVRVAICADWATQLLSQALRGWGYGEGRRIDIYEGAYDQMEAEMASLCDPSSDISQFSPQFILLFPCAEKLRERFYKMTPEDRSRLAERELERIRRLFLNALTNGNGPVLFCNYGEVDDAVYGNMAGHMESTLLFQIRKLNQLIAEEVNAQSGVYLVDMASLQCGFGRRAAFDPRLYYTSKIPFSLDFHAEIAQETGVILKSLLGQVKKCVIVDLDNTLWGGIIGDDGMEQIQIGSLGIGSAYSDLQVWLKELSARGVLLAVCSKNEESIAKEPFEKHPDMVLRLSDIAVFTANWKNKADNILQIQKILNLGLDSMVFLDDNPFERDMVRQMLPSVSVPELPADPALYVSYLQSLRLFEAVTVSQEDRNRTKLYQEEAARVRLLEEVSQVGSYLKRLEMGGTVSRLDAFRIPRAAQLTQRSNQFNLRTIRYTEVQLTEMTKHPDQYETMSVELTDRFGEYGMVGVVILQKTDDETWFLDTLLMSCRVLKRTVEEFAMNSIVEAVRRKGGRRLEGEYIPTSKNAMVKDLLSQFGFVQQEDKWILNLCEFVPFPTYVLEKGCEK